MTFNQNIQQFISKILDVAKKGLTHDANVVGHRVQRNKLIDQFCCHLESKVNDVSDVKYTIFEPPQHGKIYTNNYLNFDHIKAVGFDLDYTLVNYTKEVPNLVYNLALDILITKYGFPNQLKEIPYDDDFAIRGLSVDIKNGVLLKLNHLQRVSLHATYKGRQPMTLEDIDNTYGASRHIPFTQLENLRPLYDLFSIVEASLIANSIDYFEYRYKHYNEPYRASAVMDDIQESIKEAHVSGVLHNAIKNDLSKYIKKSSKTLNLLQYLQQGKKQLFLCTNSPYSYANQIMCHLLGIQSHEWRDLFDIIICSANKPKFFHANLLFRQWNIDSNNPSSIPVQSFQRGNVYIQGSSYMLHNIMKWNGKDILFIGDNLRADLRDARRMHGWHTACVLNELENEIDIQSSYEFQAIYWLRGLVRQFISDYQQLINNEIKEIHQQNVSTSIYHHRDQQYLYSIEHELHSLNYSLSCLFNQRFGSVFRTDGHPSLFAFAVKRYCDLYMCDVTDLLNYSTSHRFYPRHGTKMVYRCPENVFITC